MNNFNKILSIYTDKSINGYIRGVAWLATIGVVVVVGKVIYDQVTAAADAAKAAADTKTVQDDLNKAILAGQQPSYGDSQYNDWANSIADLSSNCDWLLTDDAKIKDIFRFLNNDVDFLKLQLAFGVRTISRDWVCGGDYKDVDLIKCVQHHLWDSEINNSPGTDSLNNILAAKGITYRF